MNCSHSFHTIHAQFSISDNFQLLKISKYCVCCVYPSNVVRISGVRTHLLRVLHFRSEQKDPQAQEEGQEHSDAGSLQTRILQKLGLPVQED